MTVTSYGFFHLRREGKIMAYTIKRESCVGCGACKWVCLFDVPVVCEDDPSKYIIDKEKCVGCGHCEKICPNNAIVPLPDHKKLLKVTINKEKCIGCTVCRHICPEKAPFGERKSPFEIDQSKCFRCGACARRCHSNAIEVEYE